MRERASIHLQASNQLPPFPEKKTEKEKTQQGSQEEGQMNHQEPLPVTEESEQASARRVQQVGSRWTANWYVLSAHVTRCHQVQMASFDRRQPAASHWLATCWE